MNVFNNDNNMEFVKFTEEIEQVIVNLSENAKEDDTKELKKLVENFKRKTEDFYRKDRKLNIGVVGQVKAGKSSFLNTLLFEGNEILPKASTPKTATLTKMEYSEKNIIHIEYYSLEEWKVLEDNAKVDSEDEVYTSAREIIEMMKKSEIDSHSYLEKKEENKEFDNYEDLIHNLNDYVGEDGKFTPMVKAVTLFLNKEEFKELSIVDTPGLNDPIASRTIKTKEFMEICDVVFFLSQSGSFLDKSDWTLLSSQLPQKGVKKLVLIASKYDSGIRDVLRVTEEDDIFGEDENTANNIPKACKIIQKKLKKRAKEKVEEFVKELQNRECSKELVEVIKQCSDPILVSALSHNISNKSVSELSDEEKNVYDALSKFSKDIQSDLKLLGNMEGIKEIFDKVVTEKEIILEGKAKSFIPNAKEELKQLLYNFKEKTEKRVTLLAENDREQLVEQKRDIEIQMGKIKVDVVSVFSELNIKLESEKSKGVRELRDASKEYMDVKERIGSITRTRYYTTGHLWWKKTESTTYEEHYSYVIASDAISNLRKYSVDAINQVEEVFAEALQLKEIKRKLLNVVTNNFDLGSEKYDSSLFRLMVEETISRIELPVIKIDISQELDSITTKFTGELTSADEKNNLTVALSKAVARIYEELSKNLEEKVKEFKVSMNHISENVQKSVLENINKEFNELLEQCENKEVEIEGYRAYIYELEKEIKKVV